MRARSGAPARILTCLIFAIALFALAPARATAHAALLGTVPANGQLVQAAPDHVELSFTEDVDVSFGGIKVYGPDGRQLATRTIRSSRKLVRVDMPAREAGTYAVSWRVLSADGHPARGAFVFDVKRHGSDVAKHRALAASTSSRAQAIAYGVARGVTLLGLLGAVGGTLFSTFVMRGWRPRWLAPLLLLVVVGSLASYVLDAAIAGGFSLSQALHRSVLSEQAGTVYGRAGLIRLALALVSLALAPLLAGPRRLVALATVVALGASQSLAGHAVATDPVWLRLPLDMLHTLAAAAWLGGLMQLLPAIGSAAITRREIERYSKLALGSVIVLLATGTVAAYTEIGLSLDGLVSTTYGRLVLGKTALYGVLVGLGALNRQRVLPALARDWSGAARVLRRYVAAELGILLGVLVLTAWLIAAVPARNELRPGSIDRTVPLRGGGSLQLVIDPGLTGRNAIHAYVLDRDEQQDAAVTALDLEAANARLGIQHLEMELHAAGPGHYTAPASTIPFAGSWRFRATIRRGSFDEESVDLRAPISER